MTLSPFTTTLLAGVFLAIAFLCVCLNEIFSSPDQPNYPNATWYERAAMFTWAVCLGVLTRERFELLYADTPTYVTAWTTVTAGVFSVVEALRLYQQLRRWLPAATHERIRRLLEIASCGRKQKIKEARALANMGLRPGVTPAPTSPRSVGAALAELTLDGWNDVVAPGEGAEALGVPKDQL